MATIPGGQFQLTAQETVNIVTTHTGKGVGGSVGGDFNIELFIGTEANAPKHAAAGFNDLAVLSPSGHQLDLIDGKFAATDSGTGNNTINAYGTGETISGGGAPVALNLHGSGETANGGAANDTIQVFGSGDTVHGGSGDDTIRVLGSHDTVKGGGGSDSISVFGDHDTVGGGAGHDTINVSGDHDTVAGGGGHDTINVTGSHDTVSAGSGNAMVTFGGGHETLADGAANYADTVVGFSQSAGDKIQLSGSDTTAHALAHSKQVNGGHDTLITLNDGSTILLKGIGSINSHFFS
jgi:Ca2+-binding RTX toxin-like protein